MVRLSLSFTGFLLSLVPVVRHCERSEAIQSGSAWLWTYYGLAMTAVSNVQHTPIGVEHCFLHHLRQGRMREHGVHQLLFGRLQVHGDDIALDQLGDLGADHVRP